MHKAYSSLFLQFINTLNNRGKIMNFAISHLTVEYLDHPLAIDTQTPKFGWWIDSEENGLLQTAYRIVVSFGKEIVWDSGRVESDQNFQIVYGGKILQPASVYNWQLTVWDQENVCVTTCDIFETGLLSTEIEAWHGARWIGSNKLPLYADALSVFKMNCSFTIKEGSTRGGFLFGGDDPRLFSASQNYMRVKRASGESFLSVVLDISELVFDRGQAKLLVYRQGYTSDDRRDTPLFTVAIEDSIIDNANMYASHTIYMECEYGQLEFFVDRQDDAHRLLPQPDSDLSKNTTRRLNVNPVGRGGDYTVFPVLAKVGLLQEKGQQVSFQRMEISNYREPSNLLYSGLPPVNELIDPSHLANTMLATTFVCEKKIKRARAYATARGIYKIYINGDRVGEDYLTPGMSQYDKHQFYQTYDITATLQQGTNAIGAVLAEGWFSGSISYTGSNWNYYGDRNSLLLQLLIEYSDGSSRWLITAPNAWRCLQDGPIRYASLFQGQVTDLRKEYLLSQFTKPDFDYEGWESAEIVASDKTTAKVEQHEITIQGTIQPGLHYDDVKFMASPDLGVRPVAVLSAKNISQPAPDLFIYDFGQNIAGIPSIQIVGREGQEVVLRFAEVLYPDRTEFAGKAGTLMLENIRGALATDRFILRDGSQILQPEFTFHGFRYMEITGIDRPLPLENVQVIALSSIQHIAADFTCSDDMINRLYQNICWSLRDNFLSIPTDCPQRNERMGWSGDLSVFGRTASYMSLEDTFLRKHMIALRDTQVKGRFCDIAPLGGGFGGTLWGSVGITVPWEMYQQYGDKDVLVDMYDSMKDYIAFLKSTKNEMGIVQDGPLGDWLGPQNSMNESAYLWQCYYLYDLSIVKKVADILDKKEDNNDFAKEYEKAYMDFEKAYRDSDTLRSVFSSEAAALSLNSPFEPGQKKSAPSKLPSGRYLMDTQTSYAVALGLGIYKPEQKAVLESYLNEACSRETVDDVGEKRNPYTLMTGFIGTSWISQALSGGDYHSTAWRMLKEREYPSWLYPVQNGATTIWERLNSYTREDGFGGNNSMNSFNHYSFGAVGTWMLAYAGGIRRDVTPGTFKICPIPDPDKDITWVETKVDTVSGSYQIAWKWNDKDITYSLHIPGGRKTSVELIMDEKHGKQFAKRISENPMASDVQLVGNRLTFNLLPGSYRL